MPSGEAKSAFLPLLTSFIVCVVSVAGVVVFVPLVDCFVCTGNPMYLDPPDRSDNPLMAYACSFCERRGSVSLSAQWFMSDTWRDEYEMLELMKRLK